MSILLTGGSGYIGSQLSYILTDNNFKHFIIDNLTTGDKKLLNPKAKFYKINSSLSAERNSRFQHWYSNLGYQNFSASPVAIHDRHQ